MFTFVVAAVMLATALAMPSESAEKCGKFSYEVPLKIGAFYRHYYTQSHVGGCDHIVLVREFTLPVNDAELNELRKALSVALLNSDRGEVWEVRASFKLTKAEIKEALELARLYRHARVSNPQQDVAMTILFPGRQGSPVLVLDLKRHLVQRAAGN